MNNERLYLIMKDDLYGYMNRAGEVVIEPQYREAYGFNDEGVAWVNKDFRWIILHQDGKEYYPPHVHVFHDVFSDGLCSVLINGKYGFVDKWGKIAIKPEFDFAFNFSEGLAQVLKGSTNYKYLPGEDMLLGFINKSGSLVIDYKFSDGYKFTEGLASVTEDKLAGYIDKTGEYVIEPKFEAGLEFSEGFAVIKEGELFGYIDKTGNIQIKPQFWSADGFSEGLAAVFHNNKRKIGFINKEGEFVIKPKFNRANKFQEGYAPVLHRKKAGYIYKNGKFSFPPKYNYVSDMVDGLGFYSKRRNIWEIFPERESGYIDMDNNKIRIRKQKIDKINDQQTFENRSKDVNHNQSLGIIIHHSFISGFLGPFASFIIIY
ncbi:WG repeat-containing protein, partial [Candidatus Dependentiae bacterium]|nr:WG repeat-containing protein [Candidatus Dependentiae bacterium]